MHTPGRALLGLLLSTIAAGPLAGPALAHQFWLEPSSYAGVRGRSVSVSAFAGTGFRGEAKPWSPARAVRLVARAARLIDLSPAAVPGDRTLARFAPTDDGGAMLALETTFTSAQLESGAFDAYLEEEGLTFARRARARGASPAPRRERYRRCAKTWITGTDTARAASQIGLPLEIVPGGIPGAEPVLPLTVLRGGRPLAGALVKAWRTPLQSGGTSAAAGRDSVGTAWEGRTDSRGRASVPVRERGAWLVSVVDMVPCAEKRAADWESTWASLTFARTMP